MRQRTAGPSRSSHLDEAYEIGLLARWFRRPRGYTFYTGDDDDDQKDGAVPAA